MALEWSRELDGQGKSNRESPCLHISDVMIADLRSKRGKD